MLNITGLLINCPIFAIGPLIAKQTYTQIYGIKNSTPPESLHADTASYSPQEAPPSSFSPSSVNQLPLPNQLSIIPIASLFKYKKVFANHPIYPKLLISLQIVVTGLTLLAGLLSHSLVYLPTTDILIIGGGIATGTDIITCIVRKGFLHKLLIAIIVTLLFAAIIHNYYANLLQAGIVAIILGVIYMVFFMIKSPPIIGLSDVRYAFIITLALGFYAAILPIYAMMITSGISLLVGLYLILIKHKPKTTKTPMFPAFYFASIIAVIIAPYILTTHH